MKKPTIFKLMNLILAMFTNFVLFAQSHFEKFVFSLGDKKSYWLISMNIKHVIFTLFSFLRNDHLTKALVSRLSGGNIKLIKPVFQRNTFCLLPKSKFVVIVFFILGIFTSFSQTIVPFTPRLNGGNINVKGDVLLIGNSIVTSNGLTLPTNGGGVNNNTVGKYIDIDGDSSTFSSSSADLLINNSCKRIVYAGLYWASIYPNEVGTDMNQEYVGTPRKTDWNTVKFKLPTGSYISLSADNAPDPVGDEDDIIHDGPSYAATNVNRTANIVCYKNVTGLLQALTDANGTYTVADLRATTGSRNGGCAGGWTLVIIYESPTLPSKYISVFDGFAAIRTGATTFTDINVSGFQTVLAPLPVNAKIGVSALEGDRGAGYDGDSFLFKATSTPTSAVAPFGFTALSDGVNPVNDFFNSTNSNNGVNVTNRNPASTNMLGYDIDNVVIPPVVIPNGETSGTLRMKTDRDTYFSFLTTFAIDIIEPKITLTKEVFDYSTNPPTNVGGADVTLGNELTYVIGFQNQGNDNATNFTITDILPVNTKFNYPTDIDLASLPPGTTHSYDAATRTILFTIPNNLVEINDPRYTIRFKVKVAESCNEISDVCAYIIKNTALSKYSGTYNSGTFGDKSLASYTSCNIGAPEPTNFLVDVDDCSFEKSEILCGASIQIKAANGYSSYSWSTSNTGVPVIGTGQTLTVVKEGVYYVQDTAAPPCLSIKEKVTVTLAGGLIQNPVLPYAKAPYAGSVTICPDNGKELPNLFLCGANDFRDIKTGISGTGTTIVWEKLNESESSCAEVIELTNDKCAIESSFCNWIPVATGPDYRADTKGQYRLTITYQNDCVNYFYFNVFKNELSPTETHTDIICTTNGNITINGVPAGYEYSLSATGTYQDSNSFTITTPGVYTVYIRQKGVTTNPCLFQVSNITVRRRDFTVDTTVTHPLCYGTKGSIKVAANDVRAQYYYELFKGGTSLQKVGPVAAGDYTFNNLDTGDYSFTVTTDDGCTYTNYYVHINESAGEIIATAAITRPLTDCTTGIIKITTSQDRNYSNSFYYFVNGSSTFQTSNEIEVTTAGTYTIRIVGTNNCEKTISIDVPKNPKPTYTVSHTNSNCYNDGAEIRINLTSATTGYTMGYSINGGISYQTSPVFSNLQPGTYNVLVKYSVTYPISNWPYTETKDCLDPVQPTTITGPSSAVTASAGVGELAGCGPLQGGQPTGLIRFTNVEGGIAPYQYSFDGGATWQTSNEKYVVSSTVSYDLRVKDNAGCIYKIPYNVILDPKPEDPVIDSNVNPVYNCDGTATATVVVNTPTTTGATYTYEYYLKTGSAAPVPNTPITNNVFTNVPSGNHTVIVKYNVTTVSTYSNLLQEDFGRGGDTTSPGINSAYCWEKQDGNTLAFATCSLSAWHPWLMNDGDYVVTSALLPDHGPDYNWILPKDHTAVLNNTPTITDGRFLAVNIGNAIPLGAVLYKKPINDVIPNQDINVTLYMLNLLKATNNLDSPQLTIQLVKGTTVIASQVMPSIPRDEQWHSTTDLAGGTIFKLNPGNNTSLDFQIISNSQVIDGNDLAVDDILVYQIPKACGNEKSFPIVIDSNSAFNAPTPGIQDSKCSSSNDGSITITATNFNTTTGFYYSTDNGSTWNTSTTSPVIISGLGAGIYKVIVKNDVAGTCKYSFDSEIKAPQAILIVKVDQTAPTCTTGGTITVTTVTGGTGSYQYQLSDGSGIVKPFQSSKTFTNIPQGNYTIQVKDANDCTTPASAPIVITTPTGPTATLAATTDWCYTPSNPASLVVTVTGGLAPYTYKLDSNTPINTNTFNNVAPGTHTILVTDSNNCTAPAISNIVIEPQLQLNATLTQDLTCLVNASITTAVTGGYGAPYTYTVSYNGGAATTVASFPYTATLAGSYVFTVTDTKGCPATSNTIVVSPKTTPTLTTAKTDITCNNANNGTITVTAANGATTTYTYAIKLSSSAAYTTQATNQFTGLSAGAYNIKVIDSKGCESAVSDVTIANPALVTGSISATELQCSTSGTVPAVVTVTGGGGTSPYKYSFNGTSNFTTTNTFSTSVAGTVTAYIQDANNCQIGPLSITIGALEPITDITITDNGYDCSTTPVGGQVTISAVKAGASNPISYQIISGPAGYNATANSTGVFQGLAAGSYVFQVTDTKTNCTLTKPYTISGTPAIAVGGSVLTTIKCFGGTGNIQFTVSGVSTSGYDYIIKNSGNTTVDSNTNQTSATINLNNVPASNYTITITDIKTKCTATYTVILTQPSVGVSITSAIGTNVNCNNDNSQITVTATGGTPNYTYAFAKNPSTIPSSTYGSSAILTVDTNSSADLVWDVYVRDANGCVAKTTVLVIADAALSGVTASVNQCVTAASLFTITASGTGVGTLQYSIDGTNFKTGTTFDVAPGSYIVTVKDGNNCTETTTIDVYPAITANAILTKDITCSAPTAGIITVTVAGGKGPYTYQTKIGGGSYSAASAPFTGPTFTYSVTSTVGNTYQFLITDSNSPTQCTFESNIITTNTALLPTAVTSFVEPTCNGSSDGSVTLTATGGLLPYEYSINGGLPTGTNTFGGLSAGTYSYIIRDKNGCEATGNITLTNPASILADIEVIDIKCNTNVPGSIRVNTITGTVGSFVYRLYNSSNTVIHTSAATTTLPTVATPFVFPNNLSFGDYYVTIVDSKGCEFKSGKLRISTVPYLQFLPPSISGDCETGATVDLLLDTTYPSAPDYIYSIYGDPASAQPATSSTTAQFTGLKFGQTYFFQVVDNNSCTSIIEVPIAPLSPIKFSGIITKDVTCVTTPVTKNGSIDFTVSDYDSSVTQLRLEVLDQLTNMPLVPPVFKIVPVASLASITDSFTGLGTGSYTLQAIEIDGTKCSNSTTFDISQPAQPLTSAITSKANANCNNVGQVTLTTTGGTGPYTYAYALTSSPLPTVFAPGNVLNLAAGTWNILVKDINGCEIIPLTTTIDLDPSPVIALAAVDHCAAEGSFGITVSATTAGIAPYSISVNDGAFAPIGTLPYPVTGLNSGTHKIIIQDANGCIDEESITLYKKLSINPVVTKVLDCTTSPDAEITLSVLDGNGPFTYELNVNGAGFGLPSASFTGSVVVPAAVAGTYEFRVTDSNSCVVNSTVTVDSKAVPAFSFAQTPETCITSNDGTITITATAGVSPFMYSIDNGANYQPENVFTGLDAAGSYTIIIKDAKECLSATQAVTIAEPSEIIVSHVVTPFGCDSTNASKDAIVTITASGGAGSIASDYTYSFDGGNNFQSSPSFAVNTAQTINYVVHDANGCVANGSATVSTYSPPTDMDLTASPIYCNTPGTVATITVNSVAGGATPYTYEIISPAAAVTAPSAANSFANLAPETYVIKVTDNNGCSTTKAIVVEEADKISVTAQLINDVYCNGGSTGAANFTVANYIAAGNYTFTLSPNLGTMAQNGDVVSYTALPQGNYTFTVTDGVSGCQASVTNFVISEPTAALSSTSVATNINCNNDSATITVTPSGGTAPYKYVVVKTGDPAPAAASYVTSDQLVVDTNNGVDVNWTVYVLDSNNCDTNNVQPILLDTNPIIASAIATQCPSATGTYDITVTATGFSTALLYSVDGVSYNTNNVIAVNAPGVYNVTVKDANGCVSTATPVTITEPLILTPTVTSSPSCTDGDGVVAVATTGGSGNYEYKIDNGTYGAITPFAGVASGSHTIYVHDITTDCEMSTIIDLKPATQITGFALTPTHVTCNGGNDGTITATMATPAVGVNDNPVYVYSLNGGTPQDSPVFSGLIAGTYTVEVISERDCKASDMIEITQPNPVLVNNVAVSPFICTTGNTSNFATITVDQVTGGSGIYTYEFIKTGNPVPVQTGTSNTYTEYDLSGGSYTVNVYDSNTCNGTYATSITIDPFIGLDKINVINTAITCTNLEDITATAVDASGTTIAGIQYTLTDVNGAVSFPSNATGNFTGLPVGQYIITALNPATGCSIQKAHYVNEPNTFDLNVVKNSDVVCYGSNEGAVSITLIDNVANPDEAGAFTYTVSGPVPSSGSSTTAGPLSLTGLTAGQYTVSATLSNSPFCPVTAIFTISQPDAALSISETHTDITCISGNNDGSISVTATGGWAGGYEYQLENSTGIVSVWSATYDYPNLTAETYTVRVRDTKNCIASVIVPLVIPTPIVVTASPNVSIVLCNGDTSATITATNVTGGQGTNYSYTLNRITATEVISSGPQVSPSFSGLGAGTYSITVTDGFNCSGVSADITITEPTLVTPTLVQSGNATCLTQASLTLSATGGTGTYTYSADANFATILGSFATSTTFNVAPGDYQYYVKDANGCVGFISNGITVPQQPVLGIEIDVLNAVINCKGDATGVIVAKATGGLGNYIYTLLDNNGTVQGPKADGNFTDLPAGTYTVHVDSGVDCKEDSLPIPISEPTAILASTYNVTNVTCNGNNDGKIVITATGGTGTIMYAISPNLNQFFDTNEFDNLAPGTYQVVVQDVLGCFHTIDFTITQPTSLAAALIPNTMLPEECKGDKNGAFSIEINGATAPYSVSLDAKNGTYTQGAAGQTRFDFTDLAGGKHIVYIKDAASCTYELEVIMPDAVVLNPTAEVNYDCVNNAPANSVTITLDASITNPADVDYALDGIAPYQPSNIFTNVAPGTHFVVARHTNGCEVPTANFTIVAVNPLTLALSAGQPEMNVISVTAAGGAPAYEYSFNGEPFTSSNTYKIYKSEDYEVIVRDQNGCTATIIVPMIYIDVCIPNYFTPNGDGLYDGWGPGCTSIYNNLEFSVFDRYGRTIAKYHYGEKWDGKYNGEELPTGDYWYVLKLNDAKDAREFVGHFTLYR